MGTSIDSKLLSSSVKIKHVLKYTESQKGNTKTKPDSISFEAW